MTYRRTAISSFPRAVLVTSVIGLTFLPVAQLFAHAAPSLRPLVPIGSLVGCQSIQMCHHHPVSPIGGGKLPRVSSALTFPAPTLCSLFSVSEGTDPSTMDFLIVILLGFMLLIIQIFSCSQLRELFLTFSHAVKSATRLHSGTCTVQYFY
jgi:hypothetical protein